MSDAAEALREPSPHQEPSDTAAAVDLGSNSFHMVVARTSAEETLVVDRLRETVRLAAGLDERRKLTEEAQERALACLRRFGERLAHIPPARVRAVGTNTLRTARNANDFLLRAEEALGHPIDTISGIEEARLIYLAVSRATPGVSDRRLVIDVGGGSTEIVIGEGTEPLMMESLYMGCVSMSHTHFPDGRIDAAAWKRARLAAAVELEPLARLSERYGWEDVVGTSGTIRAIGRVCEAAGWTRGAITPKSLRRLEQTLIDAGHVKRLKLTGLSTGRRPVFPGGVALVASLVETLGIQRMMPSESALREGVLFDLIGRFQHADVRERSVARLCERYHVDLPHAERVERTVLELFDQVAADWKVTGDEDRRLLAWAARMHELGLDVAHAHHHKHGEYVLAQSDLLGFSRDEQYVLATLVRAHRRKLPVERFAELKRRRSRDVERMAVLLRLAVILNRSRSPEPPLIPALEVGKRSISLRFPEDWLDAHPLTLADLEQEARYLAASDYRMDVS